MTAGTAGGPPPGATRCIGGTLNGLFILWVPGGGARYFDAHGDPAVPPRPSVTGFDEVYEPTMIFTTAGHTEHVMSFVDKTPHVSTP